MLIAAALLLLTGLAALLTRTRAGLIVRAGVENREMVSALGIDVRRAITGVFALGGAAAGLAGMLDGLYQGSVSPGDGTSLLIFAFVVVVLGGMGSITGTAVAAVVVGLVQQFADYVSANLGSVSVIILLAVVLLARRRNLRREAGMTVTAGHGIPAPGALASRHRQCCWHWSALPYSTLEDLRCVRRPVQLTRCANSCWPCASSSAVWRSATT